jgi:hypothetical protein
MEQEAAPPQPAAEPAAAAEPPADAAVAAPPAVRVPYAPDTHLFFHNSLPQKPLIVANLLPAFDWLQQVGDDLMDASGAAEEEAAADGGDPMEASAAPAAPAADAADPAPAPTADDEAAPTVVVELAEVVSPAPTDTAAPATEQPTAKPSAPEAAPEVEASVRPSGRPSRKRERGGGDPALEAGRATQSARTGGLLTTASSRQQAGIVVAFWFFRLSTIYPTALDLASGGR